MKKYPIILASALLLTSFSAHASTKYNCKLMANAGTAKFDVQLTRDDQSLAILNIEIWANITGGPTYVGGLLAAKMVNGNFYASGKIETRDGAIVNPELVTMSGTINSDGSLTA